MANVCPKDLGKLGVVAIRALKRMRRRPSLVMAFWQQAQLFPLYLSYAILNSWAAKPAEWSETDPITLYVTLTVGDTRRAVIR
jgi:hypothetical protein